MPSVWMVMCGKSAKVTPTIDLLEGTKFIKGCPRYGTVPLETCRKCKEYCGEEPE